MTKQDHDATMAELGKRHPVGLMDALEYCDQLFAAVESERAAHERTRVTAGGVERHRDALLSAHAREQDRRVVLESQIAETARERDAARNLIDEVKRQLALDHHHECNLCEVVHPDDGGDWEHGDGCPLVEYDAAIAPPVDDGSGDVIGMLTYNQMKENNEQREDPSTKEAAPQENQMARSLASERAIAERGHGHVSASCPVVAAPPPSASADAADDGAGWEGS